MNSQGTFEVEAAMGRAMIGLLGITLLLLGTMFGSPAGSANAAAASNGDFAAPRSNPNVVPMDTCHFGWVDPGKRDTSLRVAEATPQDIDFDKDNNPQDDVDQAELDASTGTSIFNDQSSNIFDYLDEIFDSASDFGNGFELELRRKTGSAMVGAKLSNDGIAFDGAVTVPFSSGDRLYQVNDSAVGLREGSPGTEVCCHWATWDNVTGPQLEVNVELPVPEAGNAYARVAYVKNAHAKVAGQAKRLSGGCRDFKQTGQGFSEIQINVTITVDEVGNYNRTPPDPVWSKTFPDDVTLVAIPVLIPDNQDFIWVQYAHYWITDELQFEERISLQESTKVGESSTTGLKMRLPGAAGGAGGQVAYAFAAVIINDDNTFQIEDFDTTQGTQGPPEDDEGLVIEMTEASISSLPHDDHDKNQ